MVLSQIWSSSPKFGLSELFLINSASTSTPNKKIGAINTRKYFWVIFWQNSIFIFLVASFASLYLHYECVMLNFYPSSVFKLSALGPVFISLSQRSRCYAFPFIFPARWVKYLDVMHSLLCFHPVELNI